VPLTVQAAGRTAGRGLNRPPRPPRNLTSLETTLEAFHRPNVECCVRGHTPLTRRDSPTGFNQAPHYRRWLDLADSPGSFWGVDRSLRIRETVDTLHSRLFHLGFCARGVARRASAANPWTDETFHRLQRDLLAQFLSMLKWLGLDSRRLQATCFGGARLGGQPDGRDRLLRRRRRFPADRVSQQMLRECGVPVTVVPTIANFAIYPVEGSPVGPQVEVFYDDIEIATLIFSCGRLRGGTLTRSHFVAAYAVGIERLQAILQRADFLHAIERYAVARQLICRRIPAADSPALRQDLVQVIFGIEALAAIPSRITKQQRALVSEMKRHVKGAILNLGLTYRDIVRLYEHFRRAEA
jgi:hypothetical protein